MFLFVLMLTGTRCFAQQLTPHVSETLNLNIDNIRTTVGETGGNIFYFHELGGLGASSLSFGHNMYYFGMELLKLNSQLTTIKTNALAAGKHLYTVSTDALQKINGKIYYVYFDVAPGNTLGNMMAAEVDTATLELGEPKSIANLQDYSVKIKLTERGRYDFEHYFALSADTKKTATIVCPGSGKFFISVADENRNILWSKESNFPVKYDAYIESVAVDNNGNVYITYSERDKNIGPTGQTHIYVAHAKAQASDIVAGTANVLFRKLLLVPSKDGRNIHAVAWYHQTDWRCIRGVFRGDISTANFTLGNTIAAPFDDSITLRMARDGMGYKDASGVGIYGQVVVNAFEMEDGSVNISGQPYTYADTYKIIFGSVINARVSTKGAVFARIPRQGLEESGNTGNTYFSGQYKDKVIIVYNDITDNLKRDIGAPAKQYKGYHDLVVVAAVISADGTVTRQVVADFSKDDYLAFTQSIYQVSAGNILIPLCRTGPHGGAKDGTKFVMLEMK